MNIHWAKAMEEAGVHVVYGQPALKTHAKCVLVVRREGDGVRNYVHIGTGNYHSATARLYTDFGLFTTDEQIGADVADMFNYLTGYGRPLHYRKVLIAPNHLRDGLIDQIERTIAAHSPESPARIAMKMNALVDGRCIRALYRASQAGVRVDLNVRGICCLRPGVPGISENIRVVSIVGRLLEHSRVYAFERDGECTIYISSADLMPRNLDHRVELAVPVESPELRAELLDTLERAFADNQSSWELDGEGVWQRRSPGPGEQPRNLQLELSELHARRAGEDRPDGERDLGTPLSRSAAESRAARCARSSAIGRGDWGRVGGVVVGGWCGGGVLVVWCGVVCVLRVWGGGGGSAAAGGSVASGLGGRRPDDVDAIRAARGERLEHRFELVDRLIVEPEQVIVAVADDAPARRSRSPRA